MPIRFRCEQCQAKIKVPSGTEGRRVTCPRCKRGQWVPEAAALAQTWGASTLPASSLEGRDPDQTFDMQAELAALAEAVEQAASDSAALPTATAGSSEGTGPGESAPAAGDGAVTSHAAGNGEDKPSAGSDGGASIAPAKDESGAPSPQVTSAQVPSPNVPLPGAATAGDAASQASDNDGPEQRIPAKPALRPRAYPQPVAHEEAAKAAKRSDSSAGVPSPAFLRPKPTPKPVPLPGMRAPTPAAPQPSAPSPALPSPVTPSFTPPSPATPSPAAASPASSSASPPAPAAPTESSAAPEQVEPPRASPDATASAESPRAADAAEPASGDSSTRTTPSAPPAVSLAARWPKHQQAELLTTPEHDEALEAAASAELASPQLAAPAVLPTPTPMPTPTSAPGSSAAASAGVSAAASPTTQKMPRPPMFFSLWLLARLFAVASFTSAGAGAWLIWQLRLDDAMWSQQTQWALITAGTTVGFWLLAAGCGALRHIARSVSAGGRAG